MEIIIDFIYYLFLSFLLSLSRSDQKIKSPPDNHRNQVATAASFANKKPPNSRAKRVSEIRVRLPKRQLPRMRRSLRKGRLQTAAAVAADALLPNFANTRSCSSSASQLRFHCFGCLQIRFPHMLSSQQMVFFLLLAVILFFLEFCGFVSKEVPCCLLLQFLDQFWRKIMCSFSVHFPVSGYMM